MIKVTPKKDHEGKDCLSVELTIDGAEVLMEEGIDKFIEAHNAFQEINTENSFIYDDGTKLSIVTKAKVLHDHNPFIVKVYDSNEFTNAVKQWVNEGDLNAERLFYPDKKNHLREREIRAKIAASAWAIYSHQTINGAALEINERYSNLKEANEGIMNAIGALKYDKYAQDDLYYEKVKDASTEIVKEMDFCLEKMALLNLITDNLHSEDRVNEVYRAYRSVDEERNVTTMNVTTENDLNSEEENGAIVNEN